MVILLIKLVVFDLDNVIIDGEGIDEIGKLINIEDQIAAIAVLDKGIEILDRMNATDSEIEMNYLDQLGDAENTYATKTSVYTTEQVDAKVSAAINALDPAADVETGKYVSGIALVDGKLVFDLKPYEIKSFALKVKKADAKAKKMRSESREGVRLTHEELRSLDEILSPLIRQGQPLSHICSTHSEEIKVCERSIYNYIEAGELTVCNLDLRRKVKYRKRRKKQEEIKCNKFNYRQGRTYEDFLHYMEEHPDTPVVEMDTVRGLRSKEQVLLTIMFNTNSMMLMILIADESIQPVIEVFDRLTKVLGIRRFRKLFPVILTDNGRCFKNALALEYTKNGSPRTKIFYCDPQASWQKPHIEKNHEFIRYVIPRGKTFKGYTQEDMTLIANHINSTTRPGLGYKSPYELVETEEMKKLLEVLNMSPVAADEICLSPKLLSKE